MSAELGLALPFWLDRPDQEAIEIALTAERAGIETVWVGEMATFDAFAGDFLGRDADRPLGRCGARGLEPGDRRGLA